MRSLIFLLCLVSLCLANCPTGTLFDSSFNRCYKYVSDKLAFFLAEQNCMSIGGHLASVQNGFENALIGENALSKFGAAGDFWVGANKLSSSNWSWSDNTPFSYYNWAPGQPGTNSSDQCASVAANGSKWHTSPCGTAKPYVCVVSAGSTPPTPPPCPTPPPHPGYCQSGWTYYDKTDSCYKNLLGDNFENAEATCIATNSHLASIHTAAENEFVADLASTGMTVDWDYMTWIGLRKVNNEWAWTDGTKVDFYNWAPGEPDNDKGVESCVQLLSDELSGKHHEGFHMGWNDIRCTDVNRAFVCKRPALH